MSTEQQRHILVAGLGNVLLRDDGVGVHAVNLINRSESGPFLAVDVGCAVFDALHLFDWADRILLIDAMQAGGKAGTIYEADIENIEWGGIPKSLHDCSVVHALTMLRKEPKPSVCLIGVEPGIIDYGLDLSDSVLAALPAVLAKVDKVVAGWSADNRG